MTPGTRDRRLVSSRYERASLTVTSDKPFDPWAEVLGDEVAAAMIDSLLHHADVVFAATPKGQFSLAS